MWGLQKIQAQGITDNTIYTTAGTAIMFTAATPWTPVLEVNTDEAIALSLVRAGHANEWWLINQSDECLCAVNDRVVAPHHRIQLNEGDVIEWGLSAWRLVRDGALTPSLPSQSGDTHPALSKETSTEYLDLEWFRQQRLQQNPFDIIPAHGADTLCGSPDADNTLTRLYQEYRQALFSSEPDPERRVISTPANRKPGPHDLDALREPLMESGTLQDMVSGQMTINAILDALDATGEEDTPWPVTLPPPDILQLLSPEYAPEAEPGSILPELTQREHRIVGIDSHYRINPSLHHGGLPDGKK